MESMLNLKVKNIISGGTNYSYAVKIYFPVINDMRGGPLEVLFIPSSTKKSVVDRERFTMILSKNCSLYHTDSLYGYPLGICSYKTVSCSKFVEMITSGNNLVKRFLKIVSINSDKIIPLLSKSEIMAYIMRLPGEPLDSEELSMIKPNTLYILKDIDVFKLKIRCLNISKNIWCADTYAVLSNGLEKFLQTNPIDTTNKLVENFDEILMLDYSYKEVFIYVISNANVNLPV